jgi:putative transposase
VIGQMDLILARQNHTPDQIIKKLSGAEILQASGLTVVEPVQQLGITEQTYYRWRKQYGGMKSREVKRAIQKHKMSERSACKLAGQSRSTQRRQAAIPDDEPRLLAEMRRLSTTHPRYGYRRIHRMLCRDGWRNHH